VQAAAAGAAQAVTFTAVAYSVSPMQPVEYVAAEAAVPWTLEVSAVENGAAAAGVPVQWSAAGAMTLASELSVTNAQGMATAAAVAGPLAAGAQATAQGCAWVTVCASFTAIGVDASAWRVVVVSGAGETVTAPAAFAPVVMMVTDASGHPVAGAAVMVYQTVNAAEMPCPARGRCPVAPLLASSSAAAVSDANGLFSVTGMQLSGALAGRGAVTNAAAAAGTQGFVSLSLTQLP
jgi:hypothetical protein